jgi:hypothetical protein
VCCEFLDASPHFAFRIPLAQGRVEICQPIMQPLLATPRNACINPYEFTDVSYTSRPPVGTGLYLWSRRSSARPSAPRATAGCLLDPRPYEWHDRCHGLPPTHARLPILSHASCLQVIVHEGCSGQGEMADLSHMTNLDGLRPLMTRVLAPACASDRAHLPASLTLAKPSADSHTVY